MFWTFVLWWALGMILLLHRLLSGRWVTGQTAFTGVWWVSTTLLLGSQAVAYVGARTIWIILGVHVCFAVASVFTAALADRGSPSTVWPTGLLGRARMVFFPLVIAGVCGGVRAVLHTGAVAALRTGELAVMRANLKEGLLAVPLGDRILASALYPAVLLGAVIFALTGRHAMVYLGLPVADLVLYSLAQGGPRCPDRRETRHPLGPRGCQRG